MRTKVDLLPITLRQLKISAFHRGWCKLGMGVHLRARTTAEGFDVRIRYGKDDVIRKSSIRVADMPVGTRGTLRRNLVCAGCNKNASKNLYLGKDFRFFCARCLGVDQWKIRTPMTWDLGEEVKFRQLLRRKVDQDILSFELAALRTLSPEDFFRSRPYLVPEWVDHVRDLDGNLHKKLLRVIHGKYKSVMMKRKVRLMSEREGEWLMEKLGIVIEKAFIITKKEIVWLRQRKSLEVQKETQKLNSSLGSQLGSRLEQSGLQPSVTDCSLVKTSSSLDTNAEPAKDMDTSPVLTVLEEEKLPG